MTQPAGLEAKVSIIRLRAGRVASAVLAVIGWSSVVWVAQSALAEEAAPRVSPDGTLHTLPMDIPPSNLVSPQFKEFYSKWVTNAFEHPTFPFPASRDAPQAEWDKLYEWNERELEKPLAWVLANYPVDIEDTKLAGVRVGIITPKGGVAPGNARRVLINLHGGGFILNPGLSFGEMESAPVASLGKIKVITVDYRQAPRYQYPAATEDVETVYRELLKTYAPGAIGIYGCSAGGGLAAQFAAWQQSTKLPRPGAIGVLCATLGPAIVGGDSLIWAAGAVPATKMPSGNPKARAPLGWYMATADAKDPKAYPGVSDTVLAAFPPTLFLTGTRDPGSGPAYVSHARLLKLGVDSSLYVMEGAPHAAYVLGPQTPEARDANAYIARWFDSHLAR